MAARPTSKKNKKTQSRSPLIYVGLLVIVLILCGGAYAAYQYFTKPIVITSSDGGLVLEIPRDAMPANTTIKIKKNVDMPEGIAASYQLLPDGLTFIKPIKIIVKTKNVDGNIPLINHISDKGFESLNNIKVETDQATNTITLTSVISHFSTMEVTYKGYFAASINHIPDQVVGVPFEVVVMVAKISYGSYTTKKPEQGTKEGWTARYEDIDTPWQLDGEIYAVKKNKSIIEPYYAGDLPKKGTMVKDVWIKGATFTCTDVGEADIHYYYNLSATTTIFDFYQDLNRERSVGTYSYSPGGVFSNKFQCVEPKKAEAAGVGGTESASRVKFEFFDLATQQTVADYTDAQRPHIIINAPNIAQEPPPIRVNITTASQTQDDAFDKEFEAILNNMVPTSGGQQMLIPAPNPSSYNQLVHSKIKNLEGKETRSNGLLTGGSGQVMIPSPPTVNQTILVQPRLEGEIPQPMSVNCRDDNTCSLNVPPIQKAENQTIYIEFRDRMGNLIGAIETK